MKNINHRINLQKPWILPRNESFSRLLREPLETLDEVHPYETLQFTTNLGKKSENSKPPNL